MISYSIGASAQQLVFAPPVLSCFRRHAQTNWWRREAGGQLFARFDGANIQIAGATGPKRGDLRTRTTFTPDLLAAQRDIEAKFAAGLHFVGDWHTHPERLPKPSLTDLESIGESVRCSVHGLNGFVLVIVGTANFPAGLHVMVHDGTNSFPLIPSYTHTSRGRRAPRFI